jgi:hypothetical protein
MQNLQQTAVEGQAAHLIGNSGEVQSGRKVGVLIVCSASLPSRFFRGWRAASYPLRDHDDLWSRRLAAVMR